MTKPGSPQVLSLVSDDLARLMPLFALLDASGNIVSCGPTLLKVADDLVGQSFFDRFQVRRPATIHSINELRLGLGTTLHLRLSGEKTVNFRAVGIRTAGEPPGVLMNLSFGVGVAEAVEQFELTLSDFAATDLAVEMLYVREAKAAAMSETRALISRLDEARSDAEKRSTTDFLTGLPNRRGFEQHVFRLADVGASFAVIAIDLDHFKQVNDRHGHSVGDMVLRVAADRLSEALRKVDIVARVGGDEFLAIVRDVDSADDLTEIGLRAIAALEPPIVVQDINCRIGASVGIASADGSVGSEAGAMIDRADAALYASKRAGRGIVTIAGEAAVQQKVS